MENQVLSSHSRQCSSTPVGSGKGFLSKEQSDNTGASPIFYWPDCSWFSPLPTTETNNEGTALLWYCWRC